VSGETLIGTQAGNYRLTERLGAGGMGEVYKGVHIAIGSKVAIKVLHATAARDRGLQERFILEAQAVNRIDHAGVVKIIDAGRLDNGRPFLVMELLDGHSLHELRKTGRLPWRDACAAMVAVLDALAAAHAAGVIHRDLKPANLFRTRDGRVVVLDFGIAKLMAKDAAVKLTVTGTSVGTPHYMAPEQIRGMTVTPASDIYTAGVVLFELVCGRRPFDEIDGDSVMVAHLQKRPPPPRVLVPELPSALQDVILIALAKEPAKRFPSAAAMREALRAALREAPGAGRIVPGPVARAAPVVAAEPVVPATPVVPVVPVVPARSPWARPGAPTDDPDLAITQPRVRRVSAAQPTKAVSPRRPVIGPATEPDVTPPAVVAHRERSRRLLLAIMGAATCVAVASYVVATDAARRRSPAVSSPAPTRRVVAPGATTGVATDAGVADDALMLKEFP
jgi:tRNA A-37 threonylcarbamoyl transferase component Bud32